MSDTQTDRLFVNSKGNAPLEQNPVQVGLGTHSNSAAYALIIPQIHTFQTVGETPVTKELYFFGNDPRGILLELKAVGILADGSAIHASITKAAARKTTVGVATLLCTPSEEKIAEDVSLPCYVSVSSAILSIRATVKGVAGKTINWTLVSQVVVSS